MIQNTKKINRKIYLILAIPLVIFGAISVYLAIESAAYGARLSSLDNKLALAKKQNRELSSQLIEATSLTELSEKVDELGYIKPERIHYISADSVVASLTQ